MTLATALVASPSGAPAQTSARAARPASIITWNVLIGGGTAAVRAFIAERNVVRAFVEGAAGGAVHVAGKYVGTRERDGAGIAGLLLASEGTSIVVNASEGIGIFDRTTVPVGPLRLTYARAHPTRLRATLNAWESAMIAHNLLRTGLRVNWRRTGSYGALVFDAPYRWILTDGDRADGVTAAAPVVVISGFARDAELVMRHEATHLYQCWFMQDAWGLPLERALRARVPALRKIPSWLDLGIIAPAIATSNDVWFGDERFLSGAMEAEAYRLQR